MKLCRPMYFERFHCLAGACPDTCCIGWEVVVDDEALERYRNISGALAGKIKAVTVVTDGESNFRLTDGGRCPFLMKDGLCEIQCEAGEAALCRTCHRFPRWQADYGGTREEGLSLSCPEAARLILTDADGGALEMTEDPSIPVQPNDIDAERYLLLKRLRAALFRQMRDESLPVRERIARCLAVTAGFQRARDEEAFLDDLRDNGLSERDRLRIEKASDGRETALRALARVVDGLRRMEVLNDRWTAALDRLDECAKAGTVPTIDAKMEKAAANMFIYYIYRYFLDAAYDGDAYLRVKTAAVSTAVTALLWRLAEENSDSRLIDWALLYSREVEHSQDNLDALAQMMKEAGLSGLNCLLPLVLI